VESENVEERGWVLGCFVFWMDGRVVGGGWMEERIKSTRGEILVDGNGERWRESVCHDDRFCAGRRAGRQDFYEFTFF